MATTDNFELTHTLSDYADQLHQIQVSVAALAAGAGRHKDMISRVATSVGSAFSVARSASAVACSMELHDQHVARLKKPINR